MIGEKEEGTDGESMDLEFDSEANQDARAQLREKFLRVITGVVGKNCDIRMYNNINVNAVFGGSDVSISKFYVTELKTPLGVLPHAVLRTSDIILMKLNNIGTSQQDEA